MRPQHLPSNCLLKVYDELFSCFCMERFYPGSGRYAELVAALHERYPVSTYGVEVEEEIEEMAARTSRWAAEICSQFRELRTMIARFPMPLRKRRNPYDLVRDVIYFSTLQQSRKYLLINELKRLQRKAKSRGPQDACDLVSELFLRYHSRLLAQELHLRVSEPLLRSVDQVLKAEIMAPPF